MCVCVCGKCAHTAKNAAELSRTDTVYVCVYKFTHTHMYTRTNVHTAKEAVELLRTDTGRAGARTSVLTEAQAVEVFKLRPAGRSVL